MDQRCCVFVDGENLRHSIVGLFDDSFDRRDYLPKQADWAGFFDWLVQEACPDGNRLRTYWYVVQYIDFFPFRIPSKHAELRRLLEKHPPYKQELATLDHRECRERCQQITDDLLDRQSSMRRRFDGWQTLQNAIADKHSRIEFRRAGGIRFDLFERQLGQEKAVDVKLAIDLLALRDIYDTAIIVSGDQDYVPAVQHVKDHGKTIVNVSFRTRGGRLLPGGARRLNQLTDHRVEVSHAQFKDYLNLDRNDETR